MRRKLTKRQTDGRFLMLKGLSNSLLSAGGLGMKIARKGCVLLAAAIWIAPCARAQVTAQRLLDSAKEPQNWLMYSGDYAGRRYSMLDQINATNASSLVPKWVYQTMGTGKYESTSLVVDGVL